MHKIEEEEFKTDLLILSRPVLVQYFNQPKTYNLVGMEYDAER